MRHLVSETGGIRPRMKTLLILRHAKSSWSQPALADFDRPLNERGEHDAPLMGRVIADQGLRPDVIVSSPAARARMTAELLRESAGSDIALTFDDRIYEASPLTLRSVVSETSDHIETMMIVGHNPGIEGFIALLTSTTEAMGTATLAVINLDIEHWSDVGPDTGSVTDVLRPKEMYNDQNRSNR